MRGDDVTSGRARVPILLAAVGALMLTSGLVLLLTSLVLRVATKHTVGSLTRGGAALALAGVAFGVVTLALFALGKAVTGRRRLDHNDGGYIPLRPDAWPGGQFPDGQFPGRRAPWLSGGGQPGGDRPGRRPAQSHGYTQSPGYAQQPGFAAAGQAWPTANGYSPPPAAGGAGGPAPAGGPGWWQPRPFAPQGSARPATSGPGVSSGPAASGPGVSSGPAAPPGGRGFGGAARGGSAPDGEGASQQRATPLDPTSVYSPGGLIGAASREGRGDAQVIPGHEFDGPSPGSQPRQPDTPEYAEVLHEEPRPVREVQPMPAATPAPASASVFVYRDTEDTAGAPAATATEEAPRGPFEPLVKSAGDASLDDGTTVVADPA